MTKRLIASTAAALVGPLLYWAGGFDFDQRGPTLVCALIAALFGFGFVYGYPGWKERE